VEAAREVFDAQLGAGATDALERVVVNVGLIEGGTAVNMIADRCRAWIDLRFPVGFSVEDALSRLDAILRDRPGAAYAVHQRIEPSACGADHPLMGIVQRNAEA